MSFININIINSFNKKGNSNKKEGEVSNSSTLNNNKNINETTSINVGSLTNNQESGHVLLPRIRRKRNKSIIREILIGVAIIVLSAVVCYFIFGIK